MQELDRAHPTVLPLTLEPDRSDILGRYYGAICRHSANGGVRPGLGGQSGVEANAGCLDYLRGWRWHCSGPALPRGTRHCFWSRVHQTPLHTRGQG
jgi:hypothetical protein